MPGEVAGGHAATDVLIRAGHRRIGYVNGEASMEASRHRLRGYRQALATADLPFDPDLVREGNWQPLSGYEATRELMRLTAPPTAIFCANDLMAVGCYEALRELGLRIPDDVAVMGYDDREIAQHLHPPLTTVLLPHFEMGVDRRRNPDRHGLRLGEPAAADQGRVSDRQAQIGVGSATREEPMTESLAELSKGALSDLAGVFAAMPEDALDGLIEAIVAAKRIVVFGLGREGLQMRGFAMRLFHMGRDVAVWGDMTTPALGPGDLFIVSAGPGDLATARTLVDVARKAGARAALVTAQPQGELAKHVDVVTVIPAQTMADDRERQALGAADGLAVRDRANDRLRARDPEAARAFPRDLGDDARAAHQFGVSPPLPFGPLRGEPAVSLAKEAGGEGGAILRPRPETPLAKQEASKDAPVNANWSILRGPRLRGATSG